MKIHDEYYTDIEKKLEVILNKVKDDQKETLKSRKFLFTKIKNNIERGYANKDILSHSETLISSCKVLSIVKYNQQNNNSKSLSDKLSKDQFSKILPYREYNLKDMIDSKIILEIKQKDIITSLPKE